MSTVCARGLRTACRLLGVAPLATVAAAAGVTRLADLTGVDRLGVPVVQAIRPAGRSLSVTMGKAAGLAAAATGAIMEAAEQCCAEQAVAATGPLPATAVAGAAATLAARLGLAPDVPVGWVRGHDLATGTPALVPLPAVTLDFTREDGAGLRADSNGLAAGATISDALVAAGCELVERDRFAGWLARDPLARAATAVDLATIEDSACRDLAGRIGAAGCTLLLWELTAPGGLPVHAAAIVEAGPAPSGLPPAFGVAARFRPAAAAHAAICEAAQTRAGLIVGARDDLGPQHYAAPAAASARVLLETMAMLPARRVLAAAGPDVADDAAARLAWLTDRLAAAGPLAWVDLTRAEIGVPVVKLIAPALAGVADDLALWRRAA